MIRLINSMSIIAIAVVLSSCDAPRLNPLDPLSPANRIGKVDGYIFSTPHDPLPDARVTWNNQKITVKTDSRGYYLIENAETSDGILFVEKEGFTNDTVSIRWNGSKNIRAEEIVLNYTIGQLEGYIYSYPRSVLQGVHITWKNQSLTVLTDSKGYYKFSNLSMTDGKIFIEKDGFKTDSIDVHWNNRKNILLEEKILDYTSGIIAGTVRKASSSQSPIQGAKIFWKNKYVLSETDFQGNFTVDNIPFENGWLYFESDGFSKDSTYVTFDGQREKVKRLNNLFLNSIPKLNEFQIYTSVVNKFPSDKITRIEVQASVTDEEGDIDSVFIKCDPLKFSKPVTYNISTRYFEGTFLTSDINISSMEEAIGKNFYVVVKDRNNKVFNVGFSNIKRIINSYVQIKSPANEKIESSLPTFEWERFQPGFNFYYNVQVYTRETIPVLVWNQENISKEDTQTRAGVSLARGDYFWVIWCVDDFGNRAQSTLGTFSVN